MNLIDKIKLLKDCLVYDLSNKLAMYRTMRQEGQPIVIDICNESSEHIKDVKIFSSKDDYADTPIKITSPMMPYNDLVELLKGNKTIIGHTLLVAPALKNFIPRNIYFNSKRATPCLDPYQLNKNSFEINTEYEIDCVDNYITIGHLFPNDSFRIQLYPVTEYSKPFKPNYWKAFKTSLSISYELLKLLIKPKK